MPSKITSNADQICVGEVNGERTVFLQEGNSLISARLEAGRAGHSGNFLEAHQLDGKTAKKLPRDVIGRPLTKARARAVLQRMRDE